MRPHPGKGNAAEAAVRLRDEQMATEFVVPDPRENAPDSAFNPDQQSVRTFNRVVLTKTGDLGNLRPLQKKSHETVFTSCRVRFRSRGEFVFHSAAAELASLPRLTFPQTAVDVAI